MNPGHDGAVALVEDGRLAYSLEAEKDSFARRSVLTPQTVLHALELASGPPDVLAIGGWHKHLPDIYTDIGAGYFGLDAKTLRDGRIFGAQVKLFSSSHERSHLYMTAAMAPEAPLGDCAILVWEGVLGAIYRWGDHGRAITRTEVLQQPGARYAALFALADPTFPDAGSDARDEDAGKLMALAAYAGDETARPQELAAMDALLRAETLYPFDKAALRDTPLYNCGIDAEPLHRTAAAMTNRLFEIFHTAAAAALPAGLPLLISGGCGLNCAWNRRWRECGLFTDVFVPPCPNDSGSAIGTAVDAMVQLGAPCELAWNVYSGAPFDHDGEPDATRWRRHPAASRQLALRLAQDAPVAWVQGRCEIGPRALGHRSLLASPLRHENRELLNRIKYRESYRPIAPCCLEEDLHRWFAPAVPDPYMLYFSSVTTDRLPAITHVDGTARVQSVGPQGPRALRELLLRFRELTGFGVLCNTSLNFRGVGFLNTASELFSYAEQAGIDDVVIEDAWYRRAR